MNNLKICFVFPKFSRKPIGGFKIIYQYANYLAQKNDVYILYLNNKTFLKYKIPKFLKNTCDEIMTLIEPTWYDLNKNIHKITLNSKNFTDMYNNMDVIVCTAVDTVMSIRKFETNAKKYYFIQDFENWDYSEDYVYKTYNMGFQNIVVSNWLKKIVDKNSNSKVLVLKNPIDLDVYKIINDYHQRKQHTVGLLYHSGKYKGLKYSFEALNRLKEKYSDLEVKMFGTTKPNFNLPDWIDFKYRASEIDTVQIYNSIQIFMCATIQEGYGLTGLEAMACGAALVSTEYEGVLEYAENGYNALLSPIKDVDQLVKNVSLLFDNEEERYRIIRNSLESVKKFSLECANEKLEKYICNL